MIVTINSFQKYNIFAESDYDIDRYFCKNSKSH